jgi:hypothetical protein
MLAQSGFLTVFNGPWNLEELSNEKRKRFVVNPGTG